MRGIGHASFFGQSVKLQPVEESAAEAAGHSQLRKVDMGIDEPWQQAAAAHIAHRDIAMQLMDRVKIPALDDPAAFNQQAAVFVKGKLFRREAVKNRRPKKLRHVFMPSDSTGADIDGADCCSRIAKKIRSGVAGLSI